MKHQLPALNYAPDSLQPFLSAEALLLHHGKHHRGYVEKLNRQLEGHALERKPLTEIVREADGKLFENAAQHWNHSYFWRCLQPGPSTEPEGKVQEGIYRDFSSLSGLRDAFKEAALGHFGSGWCWLEKDDDWRLNIRTTSNAETPITAGRTPILTCDLWEHAYYVDYRNERGKYLDAFWKQVDWGFVERCHTNPEGIEEEILGLTSARAH